MLFRSLSQKRGILLTLDSILVVLSIMFAIVAQGLPGGLVDNMISYVPVLPYVLLVGIGVSMWLGVCSIQLNAYETAAIGMTGIFALFLAVTSVVVSNILRLGMPLGVHLVFGAAFFSSVVISRAVMLQLVLAIYRRSTSRCRVLIYGAGTTGTQLVSALRGHEHIEPVAFVDDNVAIQGLTVEIGRAHV